MKILFDLTEAEERPVIEKELAGLQVVFLESPIHTPDDLKEHADAEVLCVFVQSKVTKEVMSAMPNLKLVVCRSMGFDHVDGVTAKEKNVTVCNVPAYGVRTVAEFAFALLLALSRKAYAAYDRLKVDGTTDVKHFEGFDLAGKTIGIVGTGNIGKNMAKIARGFGMNVVAFDVFPDQNFAMDVACEYKKLEDVVAESDVVSIHVPYMKATHHLINAELLAKFKKGSYLINTARGAIVDTVALVNALKRGHLGGAGLDVIEGERELMDELSLLSDEHHDINEFKALVAAHAILELPNVVLTPHIAFNTKEAKREILHITLEDIKGFIAGKPQAVVKFP
jgi:D-lactate dehydrogenase